RRRGRRRRDANRSSPDSRRRARPRRPGAARTVEGMLNRRGYRAGMSIDILTSADLTELTQHRHAASVSLYATSGGAARGPVGHDRDGAQTALRSAANDALRQLDGAGVGHSEREQIGAAIEGLQRDSEFWETSARTVAVFAAPGMLRAFRLRNELPQRSGVGDRFDVGPLVRATTFG